MCVISMVHDAYWKKFEPYIPPAQDFSKLTPQELHTLRKMIKDYQTAMEAAKVVDKLTAQPDCEDPNKAELKKTVRKAKKALKRKR